MLAEYAHEGSETAFRELVTRYLNLVYSTALRLLEGDAPGAQDVAQAVFVDLARMAGTFPKNIMLGGWLHRHTCFVAAKTRRGEWRRHERERQAVEMNTLLNEPEADFSRIAPILDDAINQLGEDDRAAILLRFFEQHDFRRIGQALGSNENAARMRVNRALDKLESLLRRRGITASAAALALALSAQAVKAAPTGLAAAISTAAALTGAVSASTLATVTTMNWINVKAISALIAASLAAGAGTYLVQQRAAGRIRAENENLISQRDKLAQERDQALSAVTANTDELERLQQDQSELLRLRGEVGGLRLQTKELQKLRDQNHQLQSALAKSQPPAAATPTDADADPQRQAVYAKMSDAKLLMLGVMLYAKDNQDQFPSDLSQVTNYSSQSDHLLTGTNQFELVIKGSLADLTNPPAVASTIALREKQASLINGKWFKAYGFADGHAEYKPEPPEGFDAWEKQHLMP